MQQVLPLTYGSHKEVTRWNKRSRWPGIFTERPCGHFQCERYMQRDPGAILQPDRYRRQLIRDCE
ncbi:hypothetical protein FQU76_18495 [Streptomyces qinzhouensis]|uniref:Uncharacterized protein n=1 Tax=Streptomyces qinzhouensis TaxID=2599401 RepID=A0A5B8IL09_9ACTN|nr:hypothetical protein FQU76_18495 [Streptomyces qinzhouensis]